MQSFRGMGMKKVSTYYLYEATILPEALALTIYVVVIGCALPSDSQRFRLLTSIHQPHSTRTSVLSLPSSQANQESATGTRAGFIPATLDS